MAEVQVLTMSIYSLKQTLELLEYIRRGQANDYNYVRLALRLADPNHCDEIGFPALNEAIRYNADEKVIELLLQAGARYKYDGTTMLHHCTRTRWFNIIKLVVENGADINEKDAHGETAIIVAAREKNKEVVTLLINLGADVNCRAMNGQTLLHFAAWCNWISVAEDLLGRNIDINAQEWKLETALHYAIHRKQTTTIKLLLRANANCHLRNDRRFSAFDYLAGTYNSDMIAYYIMHNGFISPTKRGVPDNPFMRVCVFQNPKLSSQCVINFFNHFALPELYNSNFAAYYRHSLPAMEYLMIKNSSNEADTLRKSISMEIKKKGYYNMDKSRPMVLKICCVNVLLGFYQNSWFQWT